MKISYAILGAGALLLVAAAVVPPRPAVIASVDIEKVFSVLDEIQANNVKVNQVADAMTTERDRLSREMQDLNGELETYKPGSPPYNQCLRKVEEAVAKMRAQEQFGKLKVEAESANLMRELYEKVKKQVAQLAKEQKIDYVIVDDSLAPIEPTNLQGTKQQMALRRFLYATPEFDLTTQVIENLNKEFKASGGKVPAAASAPAPGTATASAAKTAPAGAAPGSSSPDASKR